MPTIDTSAAAFVAGLVTSLHCVGMCGPLSCSWVTGGKGAANGFLRNTTLYHGARMLSYALVGALAGALGVLPLKMFHSGAGIVLPWLLVLAFIIVGLGLDAWLPKPAVLVAPIARIRLAALKLGAATRAAVIGLATPLLPCGPLYLMFGLAMANGSALRGSEFAVAFGLGTLPLLFLAQTQLQWLGGRLQPATLKKIQRGLALVAALIMAWRLRDTLGPESDVTPSCCHAGL